MKDFNEKKQDLVSSRESMSTKGIGTTVDATTIPFSCKSMNSNQNVLSSNNNQERNKEETNFENERFQCKKQDLVSSRESMSTKGIGTTVDVTTIPVSCKSTNLNQNVACFSPDQFKQQSREEEGGDKS